MRNTIICVFIFFCFMGCKEKFESPYESPDTGYLVVEGAIYSGPGKTILKLSRTGKLDDKTFLYESGAKIKIEGEDNSVFNLYEDVNGSYIASNLALNNNQQYRLRINTNAGKEYLSDYVSVITNPAIDSIPWAMEKDGLQVYVDTHNPQNNTRYYQWDYIETWKFQSQYPAYFIMDNAGNIFYINPNTHLPDTSLFTCWRSDTSRSINLGSSEKLSDDVIHLPVSFIPAGSQKLSLMYSIFVVQTALSKQAYEFLGKMKKNTEQVGSIFDPQPSQLKGNIHSVSDPSEQVIGFVNISNYVEKRIFIKRDDLPFWNYDPFCNALEITADKIAELREERYPAYVTNAGSLVPPPFPSILFADHECIDCTLTGTNIKPVFWP